MAKRLHEMTTTRIDMLRHGQCEGGDIFRGQVDARLTEAGEAQMRAAYRAAQCEWDVVISSPLQRCWQFAKTLKAAAGGATVDVRLREMSFGDWDGVNIAEIWQRDYERISAWSRDPTAISAPNGEPLAEVAERVAAFYADCVTQHHGKKVLLVTHGGIVRVLLTHILGMPLAHANRWEVPYGCLSRLAVYRDQEHQQCQLVSHNAAAPLA